MDDASMSDMTTVSAAVSGVSSSEKGVIQLTNNKKRALTLDLKSSSSLLTVPATSGVCGPLAELKTPGFMLTSPDVQMLQLASPDLEKFIIQGLMGQNTPTPTQIVFPKNVTEEQESYAKGFVDALNALHRTGVTGIQTVNGMAYNVVNSNNGNMAFPLNQVNGQNLFPQFFTLPNQQFLQPIQAQIQQSTNNPNIQIHVTPAKPEPYSPSVSPVPSDPQTVPSERGSTRSTNSSSGTSPINMDDQHKMKVERKRERNRLAAAKCRQRKLERISQLEERVKELKDQNTALSETANHLRDDLSGLRQELLAHLTSGCNIEVSPNLLQTLQQMQNMQS